MKVIKRSGEEVIFDVQKIENAIRKANKATSHSQMSEATILKISKQVEAPVSYTHLTLPTILLV